MSAIYKKINNTWVKANTAYTKVSGTWKEIKNLYKKINGVWTPVWTFTYALGAWGTCTVTCGGGTQTRTVICTRNDGVQFSDDFCAGLTKPPTSQACNTQACSNKECRYTANNPSVVQYYWTVVPAFDWAVLSWNGKYVPEPWGQHPAATVTIVDGGYLYTRGAFVSSYQSDFGTVYHYTICREPV